MIGDLINVEGADFPEVHLRCKQGLIYTALRVTTDRYFAPHHDKDSVIKNADWTDEPVLTCFTCISHVWVHDRDIFSDVDDDDDSYEGKNDASDDSLSVIIPGIDTVD